jgi:hypothetical protein
LRHRAAANVAALGSVETHLVLSDGARRTIQLEADLDPELVCRLADVVHHRTIWPRRFRRAHFCSTARSQVLIYHFTFGPSYADGCPVNSSIADAFDSLIPHLKARNVSLIAVSGAPIEKLLEYRERMGWGFTWASSYQSDFNSNLAFSSGLDQMRRAIEPILDDLPPVAFRNASKAGTDIDGYMTELFGFTTFALEDGTVEAAVAAAWKEGGAMSLEEAVAKVEGSAA